MTKSKDKTHPFQSILFNKNEDFLENDNFYMNAFTLQTCNIFMGVFTTLAFELSVHR